jgi:hypothetical protein
LTPDAEARGVDDHRRPEDGLGARTSQTAEMRQRRS